MTKRFYFDGVENIPAASKHVEDSESIHFAETPMFTHKGGAVSCNKWRVHQRPKDGRVQVSQYYKRITAKSVWNPRPTYIMFRPEEWKLFVEFIIEANERVRRGVNVDGVDAWVRGGQPEGGDGSSGVGSQPIQPVEDELQGQERTGGCGDEEAVHPAGGKAPGEMPDPA